MMLRLVLLSLLLLSPAMAQRVPVPPERPASIPRVEELQAPAVQPPSAPLPAITTPAQEPTRTEPAAQPPIPTTPAPTSHQQDQATPAQIALFVIIIFAGAAYLLRRNKRAAREERKKWAEAAPPLIPSETPMSSPARPPQSTRRMGCFPAIIAIIMGLAFLGAVVGWVGDVILTPEQRIARDQQQERDRAITQLKRDREDLEFRAQETIRQSLRDPSSAQFRNHLTFVGTRTVCGEVNARNAFGGLTGFQPFIVSRGVPLIREGTRQQIELFDRLFRTECALLPDR